MSNYEKITLNTWQYANTTVTGCIAGSEWLTRGYTGHEHIDEFGIINMNARMYDPLLGRMLSPDKYVQDATSIQNFNRYTYALNNPLKYTDPDGNLVFGLPLLFWGITAFIATGSTMIMTGYSPSQAFNVAATIAVTVATAGVTSSIAASGLFGNTSAIIFGSMVSSGTSFAASGGKSDLSVSFGAASYSFSRNEFGYIGSDENSGWQNFGYVLGALANLSDLAGFIDNFTHWEVKLRQKYFEAIQRNIGELDENTLNSGYFKSHTVGGDNVKDINGNPFYGADNPTLSDLSSQPHDISWTDSDMKAGLKNFFMKQKAIGADIKLSGRAIYLGLKNLTINPAQAIGSLGLGIGSGVSFLPKTILYPFIGWW